MKVRLMLWVVCALLTLPAVAQPITVGPNFGPAIGASNAGVTFVDLQVPATGNGSITSARFEWSATCANAVKIKFFRRNRNELTLIAERGPFNTVGVTTVVISPAVNVLAGDLIGIAGVTSCGNASVATPTPGPGYLAFGSDVTGTVLVSSGTQVANGVITVMGTGTTTAGASVPALSTSLLLLLTLTFAIAGVLVLKR